MIPLPIHRFRATMFFGFTGAFAIAFVAWPILMAFREHGRGAYGDRISSRRSSS